MNFSSIMKYIALALLSISVTLHADKFQIKVKNSYADHPKTINILFLRENGEPVKASATTIKLEEEAEVTSHSKETITIAASVAKEDLEIPLGTFDGFRHTVANYFHSAKIPDGVLMEFALKTKGTELILPGYNLLWCAFKLKHITVVNAYEERRKEIKIEFLGRNREQIGSPTTVQYNEPADVVIPPKHENSAIIVVVVEKKDDDSQDVRLGEFCAFDPLTAHPKVNTDQSIVTVEQVRVEQLEYKFDVSDNNNVVFYEGEQKIKWGKLHQK